MDGLIASIPEYEGQLINMEQKSINRDRVSWKSRALINSNLFTTSSQPSDIKAIYESCPPIPPLEMLDRFRTDGLSSSKLFSYPEFFVEEWKLLMRDRDGKKKKTRQKSTTGVEDRGQGQVSEAYGMIALTKKEARQKLKVESSVKGIQQQQQIEIKYVPKIISAPPPPPRKIDLIVAPPYMMIPSTPMMPKLDSVISPSTMRDSVTPNTAAQVAADSDLNGFLGKIREKQFVLKKTEIVSKEDRKKAGEPEEVSAILMRRAALENSDSDQGTTFTDLDESDDEEWH